MAPAHTQDRQSAGTPEVDLRRVAADLDHVRRLGGLASGRVRALAIAAAALRALDSDAARDRLLSALPPALYTSRGQED